MAVLLTPLLVCTLLAAKKIPRKKIKRARCFKTDVGLSVALSLQLPITLISSEEEVTKAIKLSKSNDSADKQNKQNKTTPHKNCLGYLYLKMHIF